MNTMTNQARGPDERGRALFLLAIGVLSVGAAAILVRLANVHPLTASWVRLSIGGAVLLAITLVQRRPLPHGPDLRRAVVAGVLLAAHFGLWIGSLSFTTVTASVVLVCLQPVFVVVGGAILLRETLRAHTVLGIGVAMAGALLIATDIATDIDSAAVVAVGRDPVLGNSMALAGAIAIAAYVLALRGQTGDVLATSAVITCTAALTVLPVAIAVGAPLWPADATSAWWLLALALGPQVIGHTALNAALRRLPAAIVSGSILGEPVIASALAFMVLGEHAGWPTIIGSVVTLVGVLILNSRR
jgi:drug/metabolite transporter (DMT)-like permease